MCDTRTWIDIAYVNKDVAYIHTSYQRHNKTLNNNNNTLNGDTRTLVFLLIFSQYFQMISDFVPPS